MTAQRAETLRERTRRAVQSELIDAALALFADRGFEAVTVEEIAAAAGLSKRSFFRYFASKEDVVLGKIDRQGDQFVQALEARPFNEPVWVALRRMFDDAVVQGSDPVGGRHAAELDRVIQSSQSLRAGYLERMQHAQEAVAMELDRRRQRHHGSRSDKLADTAVVAAAFAALIAAHAHSQRSNESFSDSLDAAMGSIADASATWQS